MQASEASSLPGMYIARYEDIETDVQVSHDCFERAKGNYIIDVECIVK